MSWYEHSYWPNLGLHLQQESTLIFSNILLNKSVYDAWHCSHISERDYTYYSPRFNSYCRIDIFLVDKWLLQWISSSEIADITWSDHVSLTISESESCRPTLLWRCNNRLIKEQITKQVITQHIRDYFQVNDNKDTDIFSLWNAHKAYLRGILIQLGAQSKWKKS